jgi:hypothetical protein
MPSAQDGTFTCVGHMEGTIGPKFKPMPSGYECILCVRSIPVGNTAEPPQA